MAGVSADVDALHLPLDGPDAPATAIPWGRLRRIAAFKQDLFNPEVISLAIATDTDELELDEADGGPWPEFTALLESHLDGVTPHAEWWDRVIDPVIKHDEVELYVRS